MIKPIWLLALVCGLGGCSTTSPAPLVQKPAESAPLVHDPAQAAGVMSSTPSADTQAPVAPLTLLSTMDSNTAIQRDRIMTLYNQAMDASRSALAKRQFGQAQREAEYAVQLVDQNRAYLAMTESERLLEQAKALKSSAMPQ